MGRTFKISGQEITEEQVKEDFRLMGENKVTYDETKTYQVWASLADDWLSNGDNDYILYGFKGFFERSIETILEDFTYNDDDSSGDSANLRTKKGD